MKKYNEDRVTRSADMTLRYRNIGNKQDVALNAACLLHDVIVFMRTRLRSADVHESATRPAATRASQLRWKERARKAGGDKPAGSHDPDVRALAAVYAQNARHRALYSTEEL